MQDFKAINTKFSVSGALASGDLAVLKSMGFKTIISNLPNEEVQNGFDSNQASAEAKSLGMTYIHMPANGATVTDNEIVDQFATILDTAAQPVFAHCKSGTRSAILYAMFLARTIETNTIINQMEKVGFELDFLEDEFEEQWNLNINNTKKALPHAA